MDPPSSPFLDRAFTFKSSSPPPVFSSDDSRESVDVTNYESPRIYKNKRKGTWWDNRESAHNTPESKKTKISRNFDSGIYMLSDATDSSDDLPTYHKSPFSFAANSTMDHATDMNPESMAILSVEAIAFNDRIGDGIEQNHSSYYFLGLNLEDSDIKRIGDLTQVIRAPHVNDNEPPEDGQFRSLEPDLIINLSRNRLCNLVPSLFNLQFLTALYLRENNIEELPQDIGKLVNLQSLDVSLNKLKTLPFDIVYLLEPHGYLHTLTTLGNPLLEPMSRERFVSTDYVEPERDTFHFMDALPLDMVREDAAGQLDWLYETLEECEDREQATWRIRYFESWKDSFDGGDDARECDIEEDQPRYAHHPSLELRALDDSEVQNRAPRYIARTMVSYFDQFGRTVCYTGPKPSYISYESWTLPSSNDDEYPIIIETNQRTYGVPSRPFVLPEDWIPSSRRPNLLTSSIYTALKQYEIPHIVDHLESSHGAPSTVLRILERAAQNEETGYGTFRECHMCDSKYVVPRAEWIEFWSRGYGVFIPVKVSVCSWDCIPQEMLREA
jgi:hypothetical protein